MSYKFKYHPDNWIGKDSSYLATYAEFMEENPEFPLIENEFLELKQSIDSDGNLENDLELIKELSPGSFSGIKQRDLTPYAALIAAINNLE